MTTSRTYRAPFASDGAAPADPATCRRLLEIALCHGGDYADLFFEYRAGGGLGFEEGITRSATRGVSAGLRVRVQKGDATGYAHTEDLAWDSMKRAAETAARIANAGARPAPTSVDRMVLPRRYEIDTPSIDVAGVDKRALLERASRAALAVDPAI